MHHAFTSKYGGRVNVITTKVGVCLPVVPTKTNINEVNIKEYTAIWDTGATNSVITKKVVDDLDLKPINVATVNHAGGTSVANVYLVNIVLPNKVMAGQIKVTEGQLTENPTLAESEQSRVLIGMDIIGAGDFAVTNLNDKTMMSFRIPSAEAIDFVPASRDRNVMEGGNRQQRRALKAKRG